MKIAISIIVLVLTSIEHAPVFAEKPFGLEMGASIEQIDPDAVEIRPGRYMVLSVPEQHSAFDFYTVTVCPIHGLSLANAVSREGQTRSRELDVRSMYHSMRTKSNKVDGVRANIAASNISMVGLAYGCGSFETLVTLKVQYTNYQLCEEIYAARD